jgi:hypothetical protein
MTLQNKYLQSFLIIDRLYKLPNLHYGKSIGSKTLFGAFMSLAMMISCLTFGIIFFVKFI